MKKLVLIAAALAVCAAFAGAQPVKPRLKREALQGSKAAGELTVFAGVITAVDTAAETITADSLWEKGEVISFSYAGLKFMSGQGALSGADLKPGDKIKVRYEGDLKNPVVRMAMKLHKDNPGRKPKKKSR